MSNKNSFHLKQFTIIQKKSAMKVGVDGILLGAWADVSNCSKILDVGTGTGLIALMVAQRSEAIITAVEREEKAAEEAKLNAEASPWNKRIKIHLNSFQNFVTSSSNKFDLIISNPPYFKNSLKAGYEERTVARHNDSLPFDELVYGAARLLSNEGKFSIIIPIDSADELLELGVQNHLYLCRKTIIRANPKKKSKRVMIEWSRKKTVPTENVLILSNSDGTPSEEYKSLTREFYLKF